MLVQVIGWTGITGIFIYAIYRGFVTAKNADWKSIAEARNARITDQDAQISRLLVEIGELRRKLSECESDKRTMTDERLERIRDRATRRKKEQGRDTDE
ncbi:MAG: hypothetical protein ABI977_11945 [Acidobacteriota bacterium]